MGMRVFIGSSKERSDDMDTVALWLEDYGHTPLKWNEAGLFPLGQSTFPTLIKISKTVDAAIFIFGEDDHIWYRGDSATQPRDNVLIEYGLFAGQLGPEKAVICVSGRPRTATDLLGLTCVRLFAEGMQRARTEIRLWAKGLKSVRVDPAMLRVMAELHDAKEQVSQLSDKLAFSEGKSSDFAAMLSDQGVVDFRSYDIDSDGLWKLLFDFDYVYQTASYLSDYFKNPSQWREELDKFDSSQILEMIAWDKVLADPDRTASIIRKTLRAIRVARQSLLYKQIILAQPKPASDKLLQFAKEAIARIMEP
ncbi:MAG: nucleotide-binding protein [Phycisphaeraceae bacterium]